MADQNAMQQKAVQLEMRREQAKQLQQEIMRLQAQLQELENVKDNLKSLENEKVGTDALVPIGVGIFLPGKLGNTKTVLVSAGAGIVISKTIPEAVEFIDDKIPMVKKAINEIEGELRKISMSAQAIQADMQGLE